MSSVLKYLDLPEDYQPSPSDDPIAFLTANIRLLPPHILSQFSNFTTARQRTVIPIIRNRRLKYTQSDPPALQLPVARETWPSLWREFETEPERPGAQAQRDGQDEKQWAETGFIGGGKTHVGKLGKLLSSYEEERGWERERIARRQQVQDDFIPEEDEESDEDDDTPPELAPHTPEALEQPKEAFERDVKERFIYGLLDVRFLPDTFILSSHVNCDIVY